MDLTPTQFGVLRALDRGEGMSQAQLAREVLVRPQSMGVLVGDMLDRGLIERQGPGGRGRRVGLALSAHGREVLERTRPAVRDFNAPAALGLTFAQAAMLEEILDQVRRTLEA
nr:MarR family transcriptional regulator [Actinomycetospora corticicola]